MSEKPSPHVSAEPIVVSIQVERFVLEDGPIAEKIRTVLRARNAKTIRIALQPPHAIDIQHDSASVFRGMATSMQVEEMDYGEMGSDVIITGVIDACRQQIPLDTILNNVTATRDRRATERLLAPLDEQQPNTSNADTVIARGGGTDTARERAPYGPLTTDVASREELLLRIRVGQVAHAELREKEAGKRKSLGWAHWMLERVTADLQQRQPSDTHKTPLIARQPDVTVLSSMLQEIVTHGTLSGHSLPIELVPLRDALASFVERIHNEPDVQRYPQLRTFFTTMLQHYKQQADAAMSTDVLAGYSSKPRGITQIAAYLESNNSHQVDQGLRLFVETGRTLTRPPSNTHDPDAHRQHLELVRNVTNDIDGGIHVSHTQEGAPRHRVHVAISRRLQQMTSNERREIIQRVDEVRSALAKRGITS